MTQFNERENSDWDADGNYDRRSWIAERKAELVIEGYHPATAHIVAAREYAQQEGLL